MQIFFRTVNCCRQVALQGAGDGQYFVPVRMMDQKRGGTENLCFQIPIQKRFCVSFEDQGAG